MSDPVTNDTYQQVLGLAVAFQRRAAAAERAIERVRAIHFPIDALNVRINRKQQVCGGCGTDDGNWQEWPCPTIRALEADDE